MAVVAGRRSRRRAVRRRRGRRASWSQARPRRSRARNSSTRCSSSARDIHFTVELSSPQHGQHVGDIGPALHAEGDEVVAAEDGACVVAPGGEVRGDRARVRTWRRGRRRWAAAAGRGGARSRWGATRLKRRASMATGSRRQPSRPLPAHASAPGGERRQGSGHQARPGEHGPRGRTLARAISRRRRRPSAWSGPNDSAGWIAASTPSSCRRARARSGSASAKVRASSCRMRVPLIVSRYARSRAGGRGCAPPGGSRSGPRSGRRGGCAWRRPGSCGRGGRGRGRRAGRRRRRSGRAACRAPVPVSCEGDGVDREVAAEEVGVDRRRA